MSNPKQVNYALPSTYDDGSPLLVTDIKQVNIGIRPKAGIVGTYPLMVVDITFTADAQGISHEPLAAFGSLAPGDYIAAAETVMKAGGTSIWSTESAVFTIAAPIPNPPTAVSVS
jgi:hypothetical protein